MFSYFPKNYVWNLSVDIAIESGAQIGEIEEMCAPLRAAADQGSDLGTADFMARWVEMADKLASLAEEDDALGRGFSAGTKLDRASLYYQTAERMQVHGAPEREAVFRKGQDSFAKAVARGRWPLERVEIAYEDGIIPGWFMPASWGEGPRPTMVFVNGLDSSKEMLVWTRVGSELARRGIATLHIDQPGTGRRCAPIVCPRSSRPRNGRRWWSTISRRDRMSIRTRSG